ncbi:tyrosine-type recombinase/integrase [Croceivirga sp. JEA036]|uniref:tyrosine-type recombinase/integrase n=1 Tax=Croceivirga sp. JEA036 TaxID=2721162 RepID=UPI001439A053|nr:tyrosine-type recombinase/integrase [Croceivirga sp. JEA036]NJB35927.1 tyrosine-type recombinase/integrase [Croceivirga sp. JEA036]
MSVSAFLDYLQLEKKYAKHTVVAYKNDISTFLAQSGLMEEDLLTLEYAVIRSWIVFLIESGLSARSINRKLSSLKAYFKFLLKIEARTDTPFAKHKSLKIPKKVQVPFSKEEMSQVLDQIEYPNTFEGKRDYLIINLLYTTGIRRAELVQIKLVDYNGVTGNLKVLGKRKKERLVPILPTLKDAIEEYLEARNRLPVIKDYAFLFLTKKGLKLYETLVYRVINKYLSLVSPKVKKSPHMLRHTFATHLLNQGADLNAVKELLGHASLASTQVYTHNSIAELKKIHKTAHPRSKE